MSYKHPLSPESRCLSEKTRVIKKTFIPFVPIMQIMLLILLMSFSWCKNLSFHTKILNENFSQDTLILLEVLESGYTKNVSYGQNIVIPLKKDTSWNICLTSQTIEECYLVNYFGSDSVFYGSLQDVQEVQFFAKDTSSSLLDSMVFTSDSISDLPVASNEEVQEEKTTLKKVILRIKKRPKRALGQSTVSAKSIKRMPGLAEADVIKAIQALPGVVASSDFSSKIYVRGGGADQNLFLFDNGVVYSPVHFFGLFSTFLVEGVDKVDFYKGGFSPKFGNRLSSVVDIQSRRGGQDTLETDLAGSLKVSTFSSQAHIEGKAHNFRYLFAGRVTYLKEVLDGIRALGLTDLNLDYRFYDLQGSVFWEPNEHSTSALSFYHGQDKLVFAPVFIKWGNTIVPFNYYHDFKNDWQLQFTGAYSGFKQSFELQNITRFENDIKTWTVKPITKYNYSDLLTFIQGIEYKHITTRFAQFAEAASFESDVSPKMNIFAPFAEVEIRPENWELKIGLRGNYQKPLDVFEFEPRFSARYNIDEDQRISFHVGFYAQYLNAILFGDFETINEFYYPANVEKTQRVKPTNSLLFSVGYTKERIAQEYDFTVESYFKTLNNTVIFDPTSKPDSITQNPDSKLGDFLFFGEGYSYGFEFSSNKTSGPIQGGVSYAYGHSVLKVLNAVIPAKWDIPHSFKLSAQINWWGKIEESIWKHEIPGRYFRSSTAAKFSNGTPYTATEGYYKSNMIDQGNGQKPGGPNPSFDGNSGLQLSCRNCDRYSNYFRWDLKVVDMGRYNKWNFSWTILNLTNHVNIFLYNYDTSDNPPVKTEITQFPFFPMLVSYEHYF